MLVACRRHALWNTCCLVASVSATPNCEYRIGVCTYYRDQQWCSYQVPYLPASMAHVKLSTDCYILVLSMAQLFSRPAPLGWLMLEMYKNVLFYFWEPSLLIVECALCMVHEAIVHGTRSHWQYLFKRLFVSPWSFISQLTGVTK